MTVEELIAQLKMYNNDALVYIDQRFDDALPIGSVWTGELKDGIVHAYQPGGNNLYVIVLGGNWPIPT